jgi:hypothetical protein
MRKLMVVAATASLLTGSSCAHVRGAKTVGTQPATVADHVNVTNNYALPMEIYATGSAITWRLGLVYPGMSRRFALPQALLASGGQVEFLARASGHGPLVRSGVLTVMPGDEAEFVIETNLIGSHAEAIASRTRP